MFSFSLEIKSNMLQNDYISFVISSVFRFRTLVKSHIDKFILIDLEDFVISMLNLSFKVHIIIYECC